MTNYLLTKQDDEYQASPLPPDDRNPCNVRIPCSVFDRLIGEYGEHPQPTSGTVKNVVFVPKNQAYVRIDTQSIMWLEAARSYCILHMENGSSQTESLPLAEVESYLPSDRFLRIHRSYSVNIEYVEAFAGNEVIIGGQHIPIGKQYRNLIEQHFTIMHGRKGK